MPIKIEAMLGLQIYRAQQANPVRFKGLPPRDASNKRMLVKESPEQLEARLGVKIRFDDSGTNPFSPAADKAAAIAIDRKINDLKVALATNGTPMMQIEEQAKQMLGEVSREVREQVLANRAAKASSDDAKAEKDRILQGRHDDIYNTLNSLGAVIVKNHNDDIKPFQQALMEEQAKITGHLKDLDTKQDAANEWLEMGHTKYGIMIDNQDELIRQHNERVRDREQVKNDITTKLDDVITAVNTGFKIAPPQPKSFAAAQTPPKHREIKYGSFTIQEIEGKPLSVAQQIHRELPPERKPEFLKQLTPTKAMAVKGETTVFLGGEKAKERVRLPVNSPAVAELEQKRMLGLLDFNPETRSYFPKNVAGNPLLNPVRKKDLFSNIQVLAKQSPDPLKRPRTAAAGSDD